MCFEMRITRGKKPFPVSDIRIMSNLNLHINPVGISLNLTTSKNELIQTSRKSLKTGIFFGHFSYG